MVQTMTDNEIKDAMRFKYKQGNRKSTDKSRPFHYPWTEIYVLNWWNC